MEGIPQNVSETVRVAAGAARGYPGDLADIHRRARRRRTRQVALSAAAVVAVAAGTGAGVALHRPAEPVVQRTAVPAAAPSSPPSTPGTKPAVRAPAQRLMLDEGIGAYRVAGGKPVVLGGEKALGELLPDGGLRAHPVTGATSWEKAVSLPDGGLLVFGNHDTQPGVKRTDGPNVAGLEYRLLQVDPAGRARSQRNVRRTGEPVSLVTATATTAYLWRPAGLIGHDLVTGAETVLVEPAKLGLAGNGQVRHLDTAEGRLAVARMADECVPRVFDVATGRKLAEVPLDGCMAVTRMRLSPDGSKIAVVYQHENGSSGLATSVAVIRLADRKLLTGQPVAAPGSKEASSTVSIAWADDHSLRGVSYPVGAGTTSEIQAFTVTTG